MYINYITVFRLYKMSSRINQMNSTDYKLVKDLDQKKSDANGT